MTEAKNANLLAQIFLQLAASALEDLSDSVIPFLNVQDWDEEVFPGASKNNTIKASTKLFLFQRLKSKKPKLKLSPKNSEDSAPEPDPPLNPKVEKTSAAASRTPDSPSRLPSRDRGAKKVKWLHFF